MKRKISLLSLFLILFLLAGCQSPPPTTASPTTAPQTEALNPTPESSEVEPTPPPSSDPTLSATLQEVEGSVETAAETGATFAPAQNGTLLEENGQVRTLDDGYTRIDLSTGTLIRMAPLSTFTLTANEKEAEGLLTRIRL